MSLRCAALLALLAASAAPAGCYRPHYLNCRVPCVMTADCPESLACIGGYCTSAGRACDMASDGGDAAADADAGDGADADAAAGADADAADAAADVPTTNDAGGPDSDSGADSDTGGCTPQTSAQTCENGTRCGAILNNCGALVMCPSCPPPLVCGAGGVGVCGPPGP